MLHRSKHETWGTRRVPSESSGYKIWKRPEPYIYKTLSWHITIGFTVRTSTVVWALCRLWGPWKGLECSPPVKKRQEYSHNGLQNANTNKYVWRYSCNFETMVQSTIWRHAEYLLTTTAVIRQFIKGKNSVCWCNSTNRNVTPWGRHDTKTGREKFINCWTDSQYRNRQRSKPKHLHFI